MGVPLVLKILSPDIGHKSDVGGVVLDLMGPDAVRETARAMRQRIASSHPEARIQGFVVQPMVRRPGAQELIVGAAEDPQFGPVILVGHGGIAVEALADRALGLPPLNLRLARELLARTRIHRVLQGIRGRPPADLDAIALTLVRVSQLVIDHPEIRELDINPLLVDEAGVMALDARVALAPPTRPGSGRLAIRPYPRELEERVPIAEGRRLLLRPIRPEDEPALRRAFAKLTPEEVRLRFFVPMPTLSHEAAARLTQIDYDREMALILTEPGPNGLDEIYGVVRLIADPDKARAEFAIIVRQPMTGRGLGTLLMRRILDYAREQGIREVFGVVLPDNAPMLRLCDKLGFGRRTNPIEPGTVLVALVLEGGRSPRNGS
jgi:acetyltransferase